jgi:hypothetical protein
MTKIGEYSKLIFLYGTIAAYLVLGVGILVKAICSWTGLDGITRRTKRRVRSTTSGYDRRWANSWMPRNIG